jgi:hypothetical protein
MSTTLTSDALTATECPSACTHTPTEIVDGDARFFTSHVLQALQDPTGRQLNNISHATSRDPMTEELVQRFSVCLYLSALLMPTTPDQKTRLSQSLSNALCQVFCQDLE